MATTATAAMPAARPGYFRDIRSSWMWDSRLAVPSCASGALAQPSPDLVEVDGGAEHDAGQDVLPVLVDADDDQPGREQFRDEDAENVPSIEPRPPNRLAPPITTAVMTTRLSSGCPEIVVVLK